MGISSGPSCRKGSQPRLRLVGWPRSSRRPKGASEHVAYSRQQASVISQALHFLNNNTIQLLEIEALYNGIQSLMAGSISHYLLPHDHLARALMAVDNHLRTNQPHMMLTRMDSAYYYNEAAFRTFRHLNTLFITLDAPVTTVNLRSCLVFSCMM